jgi:diguanylate cyclase (GGDEF)-like protein
MMHTASILIVEDQAVIASDLEEGLIRCGYSVCGIAASGEEALDLARQHRPDLTLMDIRLQGDMDGIQAAEILRKELDMPVIFLSAHADGTTLKRARIVAPYAFLVKPFDERELQLNIEVALYKHEGERQLAAVHQEIRDLNEHLEQSVRERTAKLEATLSMLLKAQRDAHYDDLTGLMNRSLFHQMLNQRLISCERDKSQLSVLFIDLDGFKSINDTHGHTAGDALLQAVATRIKSGVRNSDIAARFGGDEFVVLLVPSGLDNATTVADKLVASLCAPFPLQQLDVYISASVGIAMFPDSAVSGNALLECADTAMYKAKKLGKKRYAVAQAK